MKQTEREKLKSELQELNDTLLAMRDPSKPEQAAEINNILTPVRYAIEDIVEPEGKEFARYVIETVRARILKLQEESAPDTLRSI